MLSTRFRRVAAVFVLALCTSAGALAAVQPGRSALTTSRQAGAGNCIAHRPDNNPAFSAQMIKNARGRSIAHVTPKCFVWNIGDGFTPPATYPAKDGH